MITEKDLTGENRHAVLEAWESNLEAVEALADFMREFSRFTERGGRPFEADAWEDVSVIAGAVSTSAQLMRRTLMVLEPKKLEPKNV